MPHFMPVIVIILGLWPAICYGQFEGNVRQTDVSFASSETSQSPARSERCFDLPSLLTPVGFQIDSVALSQWPQSKTLFDIEDYIVRGQSGGSGGGGAEASAATDPSAILTQFQMQNIFTSKTHDANGYSNTVILQPVLPFPVAFPGLCEFLPNHIIRPTLPIISPTSDPNGPLGVQGGLGDLTLLDVGIHPVEGFGNLLFGYTAILPTASDPQLGLREWQLGPAAGFIYKEIPKTIVGFLYQQPFSFQSDAQQILVQPIVVRQLQDAWYVGWGDLNWTINTETGGYNIPLNVRVGKVIKVCQQPINIFVEPFYTPDGLRKGPASEWGVKLNVTLLFPDLKFGPLLGSLFGSGCDSCCCCE